MICLLFRIKSEVGLDEGRGHLLGLSGVGWSGVGCFSERARMLMGFVGSGLQMPRPPSPFDSALTSGGALSKRLRRGFPSSSFFSAGKYAELWLELPIYRYLSYRKEVQTHLHSTSTPQAQTWHRLEA